MLEVLEVVHHRPRFLLSAVHLLPLRLLGVAHEPLALENVPLDVKDGVDRALSPATLFILGLRSLKKVLVVPCI